MAQLNTRIVLRNDSTSGWLASESQVLLKGEVGIEFLENGKVKLKIGDGITPWSELSYFGGEEAHVFKDIVPTAEQTHADAIAAAVGETTLAAGDIAIVKEVIAVADDETKYAYTAYVYTGSEWAAMDGNYSAENVFFTNDLTVTQAIGTITNEMIASGNGSTVLAAEGKSVAQVFSSLLAAAKDPDVTVPYITSITASAVKAYETGSKVTVGYTINTNAGSYEFGPDTDVEFTGYNVTFNGNTLTGKTGTFEEITVKDNTSLAIKATASYSDGAMPIDNLGNNAPGSQIKAGTTAEVSKGTVSGYRNWYTYVGNDHSSTIDSSFLRTKCSAKGSGKSASDVTLTVSGGETRVVVAIPTGKLTDTTTTIAGYTKRVLECIDVAGMQLDIYKAGNFAESTVSVLDASGEDGMDYVVYDYVNSNGLAATTLKFDIG